MEPAPAFQTITTTKTKYMFSIPLTTYTTNAAKLKALFKIKVTTTGTPNISIVSEGANASFAALTLPRSDYLLATTAASTYVAKSGDTMTGTLYVTGLTNNALTPSQFVSAAADKSLTSVAVASSLLSASLTDEQGSGAAVFATSPTLTTPALSGTATAGALTVTGAVQVGSIAGITNMTSAAITATNTLTIPQSDDPDVTAAGHLSWDTDGWLRAYDGSAQVAVGRKQVEIHATVVAPNDMADAVRDACLIWSNESGMTFTVTGWKAWSGTDDTTLNIETTDGTGGSNATVDAVEIASNGTGCFYATDTTITAGTIANGSLIWLDFDDTDTPTYVKITIYGYYDANVN